MRSPSDDLWRALARSPQRAELRARLWSWWTSNPYDKWWRGLTWWGEPEALAEAALAAAAHPSRDYIRDFCARHGMAPADPVARAVFYALTGQAPPLRMADPDGSLLTTGYQSGSAELRTALRNALSGTRDVDLVRVVTYQGDHILTAEERRFLRRQLAGRRDWAGLWRVVSDLALADAVAAMPAFGDGWVPAGDRERSLFELLAGISLKTFKSARNAFPGPDVTRIGTDAEVRSGTFSSDGRRLAVWAADPPSGPGVIQVFDVHGGEQVDEYIVTGDVVSLAFAGDALLIATAAAADQRVPRLRRCVAGRMEQLGSHPDWRVTALAPRFPDDGFAMLTPTHLLLCDRDGSVIRALSPAAVHDRGPGRWRWHLLASGPGRARQAGPVGQAGWRLALAGNGPLLVLTGQSPRARLRPACCGGRGLVSGICFCGPDRVVTTSAKGVTLHGAAHGPAVHGPAAHVPGAHHPVADARRQEIMVLDRNGTVRYLSAVDLAQVAVPRELAGRTGTCLFGTPDGRCQALGAGRAVHVVSWLAAETLTALVDTPQASWQPADLFTAREAMRMPGWDPEARILIRLLLACLELRFGSSTAAGRAWTETAVDDIDVAD